MKRDQIRVQTGDRLRHQLDLSELAFDSGLHINERYGRADASSCDIYHLKQF